MGNLAKILIFVGAMFIVMGAGFWLLSRVPGLGKLPGDIMIKKGNFSFYFPLTTCLLLSLILSYFLYFIHKR
jgi:hypothetical protein